MNSTNTIPLPEQAPFNAWATLGFWNLVSEVAVGVLTDMTVAYFHGN
jgi:hypothetical protein